MTERNIRMTPELHDALIAASKNCCRSKSESARCCLRSFSKVRVSTVGVSTVGVSTKIKYPTNSGAIVVTLELDDSCTNLSAGIIRRAIAWKLTHLPEPDKSEKKWIKALQRG